MKYAGLTDIGRKRAENQDRFYSRDGLWVIADGTGGHAAGEIASAMAVERFSQLSPKLCPRPWGPMEKALREANGSIWAKSQEDMKLRGMGTTLTAAAICGTELYLVHVGDSRAYLLRHDSLALFSSDDSLVAELVRKGEIEPAQASKHPLRNVLTKALGTAPKLEGEKLRCSLAGVDKLLLCTDGLYSSLEDEKIRDILMASDEPASICGELVERANKAGGADNITVIVVVI